MKNMLLFCCLYLLCLTTPIVSVDVTTDEKEALLHRQLLDVQEDEVASSDNVEVLAVQDLSTEVDMTEEEKEEELELDTTENCASLTTCSNCSNTYTCHWCSHDNACHSRGSINGCAWGVSCSKDGDDDGKKKKKHGDNKKNHTVPPDDHKKNHTQPPDDDKNHTKPDDNGNNTNHDACHKFDSCGSCSKTYTCHWCSHDNACHARGSIHGCAWGSSCKKRPKPAPKPKENSTCSAHMTCSECALSSHLCHWCAHDNACHALGSRFGCVSGVDCYSNDRCRRMEPEKLYDDGDFVFTEMPISVMIGVGVVALLLCFCTTFCFSFAGGVKGAYDDLATITMAASVAPMSIVGGPTFQGISNTGQFHTELPTHDEEEESAEVDEEEGGTDGPPPTTADDTETNQGQEEEGKANGVANSSNGGEGAAAENNGNGEQAVGSDNDIQLTNRKEKGRKEDTQNDDGQQHNSDQHHYHQGDNDLTEPLLPATQSHTYSASHGFGRSGGYFQTAAGFDDATMIQPPRHMKRLYRMCGCCYCLSILFILGFVFLSMYFYPSIPIYNVCNDSVAWKQIMSSLIAFKLEGGVEILFSVSNPNRLQIELESGGGAFRYDGEQIGTFEIPPVTIGAMAITDLMVIAEIKPTRNQAIAIGEAYYRGKLVLDADIKAKARLPALYGYTYHLDQKDIKVFVNELSDRSLCHCPSWDEKKNHTSIYDASNLWFLNGN